MVETRTHLIPVPGDVLTERYQVVEEVARTATHTFYKAIDLTSQSPVALKILSRSIDLAGRQWESLIQTLESTRTIRRTGLVTVFDLFHDRVGTVFVEEWVRGAALLNLLRAHPLTPIDVLTILGSLAKGLDYLLANRLPVFPFTISDLLIDAPSAPDGDDWLHRPLKSWDAFELKLDPLPFTQSPHSGTTNPFITSFAATLYQMLGGRPGGRTTAASYRPLVSLEEEGNRVLRQYIEGSVQPGNCREILSCLAEAEGIGLDKTDAEQPPLSSTTRTTSGTSTSSSTGFARAPHGPGSELGDPDPQIHGTEDAIAAKEAEIAELQQALERRMEEKRLAELQSKLEKSFNELEAERSRLHQEIALERDRLQSESARLKDESDRLGNEKARQKELSTRLANLQDDFQREKAQASEELEARREALDQRQADLQVRVEGLQERENSIKDQQAAMEKQEAVLETQSASLSKEHHQRESDLAENAARIEAERKEVESSRRILAEEKTALEAHRAQVAKESEELARLDATLTEKQDAVSNRERSIREQRRHLEHSRRALEEQRQTLASQSHELEEQLSQKLKELSKLRLIGDRSAAQQARLDALEQSQREIETQRRDLLQREEDLKTQNQKQADRLNEHEREISQQRKELSDERRRYEALLGQLSQNEEELQSRVLKQTQAQDQLAEARAKLEDREKETDQLRSDLKRLAREQAQQEKERDKFRREIAGLQSKIGLLEEERNHTAKEQARQEDAVAQFEQDQRQLEVRLKADFEQREQLLEQQKAAAERQLRKSEKRVDELRLQEEAVKQRELEIQQREAKASELEETAERERTARIAEIKRRQIAEQRSRTVWTRIAIAAALAALIIGAFTTFWIKRGGGSVIREKLLLQELAQLDEDASGNGALEILNRARTFLDDKASEGKDYTLESGFSAKLRQVLARAITELKTQEANDEESYAAMMEKVRASEQLESPRQFLNHLGGRVGLTQESADLKLRLDQLHLQEAIRRETDPFSKIVSIIDYLEAFPNDVTVREAFSQDFRKALDHLASLDDARIVEAPTVLRELDFSQSPAPGPFLGLAVDALTLTNISQSGLTKAEIGNTARAIDLLLERENQFATEDTATASRDLALTYRLLNHLSREIRNGYGALHLHQIDQESHAVTTHSMLPVIDHWSESLIRLDTTAKQQLVEFLSLIADTTTDQRLLKAFLGTEPTLPAVYFKVLEYGWGTKAEFDELERIATRTIDLDATGIRHQRSPAEWDHYVRCIKTYAHFSMAKIRISIGSAQETGGLSVIREGEQHLVRGLQLRSSLTYATITQMLPFCITQLKKYQQTLSPECIREIQAFTRSAYHLLPSGEQDAFTNALTEPESLALNWLTASSADTTSTAWNDPKANESIRYLVARRIPPFDQLGNPALAKLEKLFNRRSTRTNLSP